MSLQPNFVIIGAGPKALAVIAKSYVLNKLFKIPMPNFHIIERKEVAANWTGKNGFTNGALKLGTAPQKDVGFPYNSKIFRNKNDMLINNEMRKFSWDMYLVNSGKYAEWIDRGRPNPTHREWAEYLKYGFSLLKNYIQLHLGELKEIFYHNGLLRISCGTQGNTERINAGYLMLTGPGEPSQKTPRKSTRVFDINSYWKSCTEFNDNDRVLIIGGGENSATVALDIHQKFKDKNISLDIITPHGVIITRGESYFENRVYTDASKGYWQQLTRDEKISFINHTDLGVYSVNAMNELSRTAELNVRKGRVKKVFELNDNVSVLLQNNGEDNILYDRVIWANGFQKIALLNSKLNLESKRELEGIVGEITDENLQEKIDYDLSLNGIGAKIFLPMISGINHGPGFSNLSGLGTLADRILNSFTSSTNRG